MSNNKQNPCLAGKFASESRVKVIQNQGALNTEATQLVYEATQSSSRFTQLISCVLHKLDRLNMSKNVLQVAVAEVGIIGMGVGQGDVTR